MANKYDFQINEDAFKIYQQQAYRTLIERVHRGERTTSIVIPPRVGKTDVMRVGGLRLVRDRHVSCAVIIVPDRILLDQTFKRTKMKESLELYGINYKPDIYRADGELRPSLLADADIVGLTIQLAHSRIDDLEDWMKMLERQGKRPPIVFVDECHTLSINNRWGDTLTRLGKRNAHICLLTATPYRTDREVIPGFSTKRIGDSYQATYYKPTGNGDIGEFQELRHWMLMKPDHITTFREVWDEADPPILCKIYDRPFDVPLNDIDDGSGEIVGTPFISELTNERRVRQALRDGLRTPVVVEEAVRIFVDEMALRRGAKGTSTTAGLIFVGSHLPEVEPEANEHALNVKRALEQVAGNNLRIAIATSDSDAAVETVADFTQGNIDVLIVKQMAGRGLDVPRLKVLLDLSNTRTPPAFVQRVTRGCTMWQPGDDPSYLAKVATYIHPADYLGKDLFDRFVKDEGGESLAVERTPFELLRTFPEGCGPPVPTSTLVAKGVTVPDSIGDSDIIQVSGAWIAPLKVVYGKIQELANLVTPARFAKTMEEAGFHSEGPLQPQYVEQPTDTEAEVFHDLDAEWERKRDALLEVQQRLTKARYWDSHTEYDGAAFGRVSQLVWDAHYKQIGKRGTTINKLSIEDLENLRRNMLEELASVYPGTPDEGQQGGLNL